MKRISVMATTRKIALWTLVLVLANGLWAADLTTHPSTDVYEGWTLGPQMWSFHNFTFYEGLEKTASLDLSWVEAYVGQPLSADQPDAEFGPGLSAQQRQQVKDKMRELGLRFQAMGVVDMTTDEAQCRELFEFAKDMGIPMIAAEPPIEAMEMVDKLCQEYKIPVALHNHPEPSIYWNPDTVLKACEGRSKWIGACADIGHWMRSGINPLDAIKKLKGRIHYFHFKDLNEFGNHDAHDVPWGTGKADVKAILQLLDQQNFRGPFSIEYEYNWDNSLPDIRRCVWQFNRITREIKSATWSRLFKRRMENAKYSPGSWSMERGLLTRNGGGNLSTTEKYGDFILDFQYKVDAGANSGVFIRTADPDQPAQTGIEIQIHDTTDGTPHGACGAIYDCLSPTKNAAKPAGQWNRMTIRAQGPTIQVVLNGCQIIDMNLDLWTQPHKNPDGSPNKFDTAYKDMSREGVIVFQDHGDPVSYRNIKIRPF